MASVNKAILIGNLGRDPELKYTPSGVAVCTFTIATTDRWTDKEGNRQEKTEWHNIKLFRRQAEVAAEYLRKGSSVYLEGRIETRSWEQDGQKKYMTEINANVMQFLGGRREDSGGGGSPGGSSARPQQQQQQSQPDTGESNLEANDDDLPF